MSWNVKNLGSDWISHTVSFLKNDGPISLKVIRFSYANVGKANVFEIINDLHIKYNVTVTHRKCSQDKYFPFKDLKKY